MRFSFKDFGSTVAQLVLAGSAVIALFQYVQSVEQNKTNAALSFIAIHNNDRVFDARKALLEAQFKLEPYLKNIGDKIKDPTVAPEVKKALLKTAQDLTPFDYVLATSGEKLGFDELRTLSLSLIYLYDSTAECVSQSVCRHDITQQHFASFMRLIINMTESQDRLEKWKKVLKDKNLGDSAKQFIKGDIKDRNMIQRACFGMGVSFCS